MVENGRCRGAQAGFKGEFPGTVHRQDRHFTDMSDGNRRLRGLSDDDEQGVIRFQVQLEETVTVL